MLFFVRSVVVLQRWRCSARRGSYCSIRFISTILATIQFISVMIFMSIVLLLITHIIALNRTLRHIQYELRFMPLSSRGSDSSPRSSGWIHTHHHHATQIHTHNDQADRIHTICVRRISGPLVFSTHARQRRGRPCFNCLSLLLLNYKKIKNKKKSFLNVFHTWCSTIQSFHFVFLYAQRMLLQRVDDLEKQVLYSII